MYYKSEDFPFFRGISECCKQIKFVDWELIFQPVIVVSDILRMYTLLRLQRMAILYLNAKYILNNKIAYF